MPKKDTTYLYNASAESLNLEFYENYDESFLLRKANSLLLIADHAAQFKEFLRDVAHVDETIDDKYSESLRAEVHFTEFHQFEAFFAILIAVFQGLPHWLYLTTYDNAHIKSKVKQYLANDISGLTGGAIHDKRTLIEKAVYWEMAPSPDQKEVDWQQHIDDVVWMLNRLAKKYEEGAEYNAYKHGLRVMTGPTFMTMSLEESGEPILHAESKDSLRFLRCKKENSDSNGTREEGVYQSFIHFNPLESIEHLDFMHTMLRNIKNTRLWVLTQKDLPDWVIFPPIDKKKLLNLSPRNRWEISV